MNEKALVSVVIPVFNRADRLREAVMSVLLQDYKEIEIIIVDDGSTDGTEKVIREIAYRWPETVSFYWQPNSGPGRARQLGTQKAKGVYIQYLDSDDLLMPEKFKFQTAALEESQGFDICYGMSYQEDYFFSPPIRSGPIRATGEELRLLFPRLLNERWWTTSTPLYRMDLVRRIGPWKDLVNEEDWEFDARAGRDEAILTWTPNLLSIRRINLASDHLSSDGYRDPKKLRDRVRAKQQLYQHAIDAGLSEEDEEMKVFARECFFLARQCGEVGLVEESRSIFRLSRHASGTVRGFGFDYIIYNWLCNIFGWDRVGKLSAKLKSVL